MSQTEKAIPGALGLITIGLVLGLAAACGGEAPDGDSTEPDESGGGGAPATGGTSSGVGGSDGYELPMGLTIACMRYVEAMCARRHVCLGVPVPPECADSGRSVCPDAVFSEGSTRTLENVLECAAAWDEMSCDDALHEARPSCALPGTRANGEDCAFYAQCASGVCSTGDGTCGVCVPQVESGGACVDGESACPDKEWCQGGTCVPVRTYYSPYVIIDPSGLDEACGNGCIEGLICALDDTSTLSICREPREDGEPCHRIGDTAGPRTCGPTAFCDTGTNECRAYGELGEACSRELSPDQPLCGSGLYCRDSDSTCQPLPVPGQACLTDQGVPACAGGSTCIGSSCMRIADFGERCGATDTLCIEGSACVGGRCEPTNELTTFAEACGG